MIEITLSPVEEIQADAIIRSISAGLDADTPFGRDVELLAGPEVTERLQAMGDLPVGAAVITPSGNLEVGFLIHVVLQADDQPVSSEAVKTALTNGLRRAEEWGLESVVVPPLGSGAGNLDVESVAAIMVPVFTDHMTSASHLKNVTIVVSTDFEREVFSRLVGSASGRRAPGVH